MYVANRENSNCGPVQMEIPSLSARPRGGSAHAEPRLGGVVTQPGGVGSAHAQTGSRIAHPCARATRGVAVAPLAHTRPRARTLRMAVTPVHATNPRPSADRSQKRFRSAETVPQRQNVSANTCSGETFPRCDLIGNVSLEIKPFDVKLCGTFRERPFDWTYDPPLRTRDGGSIVGGRKKRFLFAPTRRSPRARTFPPRVDLDALGALTRDQHERKVNKRPGETLLPLRTIWVGCIVHPR